MTSGWRSARKFSVDQDISMSAEPVSRIGCAVTACPSTASARAGGWRQALRGGMSAGCWNALFYFFGRPICRQCIIRCNVRQLIGAKSLEALREYGDPY
jgi:hypothetical protein